jgi:hypothetical protein
MKVTPVATPKTSSGLKPKAGSRLSVNAIFAGAFYHAETPLSAELAKVLPEIFFKYLIPEPEPDPEAAGPASLTYQINTSYNIDQHGHRRPKNVEREIINLQLAQQQQELLEQRLSESNAQEEAALAIVQQDFESAVARDRAQAEYAAKERANADEHARKLIAEDQFDVSESVVSPAVTEMPNLQPTEDVPIPDPGQQLVTPEKAKPRMRKRFVNRNGTWLRTKRLKRFHVGEKVYVKNASGFEVIGTVNKRGGLPACYLEDEG